MPAVGVDPGYGVKPLKNNSLEEHKRFAYDYLKAMEKEFGDTKHALMAYNWGPGNVGSWLKSGADVNKVPKETKDYIKKILGISL